MVKILDVHSVPKSQEAFEIVDPITQTTDRLVTSSSVHDFLKNPDLYPPFDVSAYSYVPLPAFRGGALAEFNEIDILNSPAELAKTALSEIFTDGVNSFGKLDLAHVLKTQPQGMFETIVGAFDHRPGSNGGRSSLRHIFKGDKYGGAHVAPLLPGLETGSDIDPRAPFETVIENPVTGRKKMMRVVDSQSGLPRLVPAPTTMFPLAWDNLTILNSILDAYQNRQGYELQGEFGPSRRVYEVPIQTRHLGKAALDSTNVRLVTLTGGSGEKIQSGFPVVEQAVLR